MICLMYVLVDFFKKKFFSSPNTAMYTMDTWTLVMGGIKWSRR